MSNPSTQRRLSSRNPFRTPLLTPNPTGTSTTSSAPSYHTAVPFSHTLLTPTPTGMSTMSSTPSYHTAAESHIHSDDEDTPEALPELTPRIPSRNLSNPRRLSSSSSLQSASTSLPPRLTPSAVPQLPSSALPSDLPPNFTLDDIPEVPPPAYSLTPDIDSGETFLVQDPSEPFQHAPEPPVQLPPSPPPPPPPPSPPSSFPERPLSPLSEFEAPPSPTTPLEQQPRYAPPPGRPPPASSVRQHSRLTPPSGAPPPPNRPRVASTSSGAGSTASPASNGHPTSTPTPGRPLLRNGRTLVYPESYLCHKCSNTGYKNFDPSHPCRKCWDRFGKPFSAILASSPWGDQSSSSASQSQHGRTFQRPLPSSNPRPPQAVVAPVRPTPPPPPPPPPPPRVPPRIPPPPPSHGMFVPPRIPPPPRTGPVILPYGAAPPPGAAVVMPGDSRIGGTLCLRCGGRGTTPFLIFDEMPCESCGGVGRLFNRPPQNCLWNKQGMNPAQGINGWSRRF